MRTAITLSILFAFCGAAMAQTEKSQCCESGAKTAKAASHCSKESKAAQMSDDEFIAEAHRMQMAAEGKKECCKSTAAKPVAKGEGDCCNAKGAVAKFKVFVAGQGYKYFGCEGSAAEGRKDLMAKGAKVGQVQKVAGKIMIH